MAINSLEFSVESFFAGLFKADPRSAGKEVVHYDEDSTGSSNGIIIRAVQGNHNLAAFGGFDMELTVEYRAPIKKASKAEKDLTAKMLNSIIYDSAIDPTVRRQMAIDAGLSDLLVKDEVTGDRSNTQDLRKRVIMIPLQAKLA